jgi:predicted DNA-binding transcriptional regulator AlpA
MTPDLPRFITDREAAKILGYSVQSLRNWRWKRTGPPYRVKNRSIRYEYSEILAWMNETTITPEDAGR